MKPSSVISRQSMHYRHANVLAEDEINALASKWWGNGIIPRHYFDALKEAAQLGAERATHAADEQAGQEEITSQ